MQCPLKRLCFLEHRGGRRPRLYALPFRLQYRDYNPIYTDTCTLANLKQNPLHPTQLKPLMTWLVLG